MSQLMPVLGCPIRREIICHLVFGPAGVGALASAMELDASHISHELGCLYDAGVVEFKRKGKSRVYRLARCVIARIEDDMLHLSVCGSAGERLLVASRTPASFSRRAALPQYRQGG